MFQFSIIRLLIVTTVVAFLVAALRNESVTSIARLLGGAVAAFCIPLLGRIALHELLWKRKHRANNSQGPTGDRANSMPILLVGMFVCSTLFTAILFCYSVVAEAFEFTTGLTPWIVPTSLAAGFVWIALRRFSNHSVAATPHN